MNDLKKILRFRILELFSPDRDTSENDIKTYKRLLEEQDEAVKECQHAQGGVDIMELCSDDCDVEPNAKYTTAEYSDDVEAEVAADTHYGPVSTEDPGFECAVAEKRDICYESQLLYRPSELDYYDAPVAHANVSTFRKLDRSFAEMLRYWLEKKSMTPPELYRRANINKQTYSRIINNPGNPPTKPIAMACAVALRLDLEQTEDLLKRAGYAISYSNITDIIFEAFIEEGIYDIDRINEAVFEYDGVLLGSRNS